MDRTEGVAAINQGENLTIACIFALIHIKMLVDPENARRV